jgi:hypothetical protein
MKRYKIIITLALVCMMSSSALAEDGDSLSVADSQRLEPSHQWVCFCSCDIREGLSLPVIVEGRCVLPDDNGNKCTFSIFPPLNGTTSSCESVLVPN